MTIPTGMPTYRQWEKFWDLHITPEFRRIDALTNDEDDCHAIGSLDRLREFFAALAGETGDAVMSPALNKLFVTVANHLAWAHEFDMRPDEEYSEADLAEMQPVIAQLIDSQTPPVLIFLSNTGQSTEINLN